MPLCMLGKPRIVILLQQLYLQDPLHVDKERPWTSSTHKSCLPKHLPFPTQTGQEKNNNGLQPTQSKTSPPKTKIKDNKKKALPTLRTVPKTSNLVDPQTVRWVPFVLATTSRHVMGCGSSKCRRDRTYRVGEVWESCPRDLV